ncbi:MAG: NAD(P)-dependent oxidoreductase, partial [Oscillospiraceae bacterium]|nr:NAD(P)-dependent oxidoreductase [Oscillospiraceae bacterium]
MKVFITGGTGNIGQYVAIAAAERGHDIIVLSRTPGKFMGLKKLLEEKSASATSRGENPAASTVDIVEANLVDYDILAGYVKGCDAVIHIALGWGNEPVSMCIEDTVPTVNLLEMSERAGVKKFIYTSSTAAVGNTFHGMDEKSRLFPTNLYGSTKAASEMYVLGFTEYCAESGT